MLIYIFDLSHSIYMQTHMRG